MSHFTVLVISKQQEDVERLLAPYHEFECTGVNDEYVVDVDITEELLEMIKNGESLDEALSYYGHEDKVVESEAYIDKDDVHKYGYAIVKNGNLIKAVNRTNPNKKWDWYQVGGRWRNLLKLKSGKRADSAKSKDVDFSLDQEKYKKSLRFWEVAVENHPLKDNENKEDFMSFYKSQYYIDRYRTKENYAESVAEFGTFALITANGEWFEKGTMGWFGMSSENEESIMSYKEILKEKLQEVDEEYFLTVVDCHI